MKKLTKIGMCLIIIVFLLQGLQSAQTVSIENTGNAKLSKTSAITLNNLKIDTQIHETFANTTLSLFTTNTVNQSIECVI